MNVNLSGANRIPTSLRSSLQTPASAEKYDQKSVQNKNNPMNCVVNDSPETTRQDLALPSEKGDREKDIVQADGKVKHVFEQNSTVEYGHSRVSKRRKPGKRRRVTVNLAGTKYEVGRSFGFITDESVFIYSFLRLEMQLVFVKLKSDGRCIENHLV